MFGREGTFEADPAWEVGAAALFAPLAGQRPSENAMRQARQRMFAALAAAGPATARGSLFGRVAAVSASIVAPLAAVSAVGAMIDNDPMQAPVNAIRSVAEFVGVGGTSNDDDAATGGAKDPGPDPGSTAVGGDVRREGRGDDGTPEASPSATASATAQDDDDADNDGDTSNSGPGGSSSNGGTGSANSGSSDDDGGDSNSGSSGSSGDDSGSGSNGGSGLNSGSGSNSGSGPNSGSGSNSGSDSDSGSGSNSGSVSSSGGGLNSGSGSHSGSGSDADDNSDDRTSGIFGGSTATAAQTPTSLGPSGGDTSKSDGDR